VIDDQVHEVRGYPSVLDILRDWPAFSRKKWNPKGKGVALKKAKLLAPLPDPGAIFCAGANYTDHMEEMARAQNRPAGPNMKEQGEKPWHFIKTAASVTGPGAVVKLPAYSKAVDWEVELAVVMGKKGKDIPKEKAYDYVFGYTICLDMTARELQRQHGQWFKGKSLDTFCPIGPWIVHKSALQDPQQVRLICRVNGEVMQDGNTRDMIFDIPTTIESLSKGMTLEPGDIISTGTPSGVGFARTPPVFLKPGDKVEGDIEGIGILEITVAAP